MTFDPFRPKQPVILGMTVAPLPVEYPPRYDLNALAKLGDEFIATRPLIRRLAEHEVLDRFLQFLDRKENG